MGVLPLSGTLLHEAVDAILLQPDRIALSAHQFDVIIR